MIKQKRSNRKASAAGRVSRGEGTHPIPLRADVRAVVRPRSSSREIEDGDCLACRIYNGRRERRRFFDESLFGEPAWDLLLMLYCADVHGQPINSAILTQAAGVPASTAWRWLATLEQMGLVLRCDKLERQLLQTVELTGIGREKLKHYFRRIAS